MVTAPALVPATFCGVRVEGGCTASFKARLTKAEARIVADYERAYRAGETAETFSSWHNVKTIGGYRARAGMHGKGEAIDINYSRSPYSIVRRGKTLGGEAAGDDLDVRRAAAEAYDRACGGTGKADVDWRRPGETVEACFDRFEAVSVAIRAYFEPYFHTVDTDGTPLVTITRRPSKGYLTAPREAFAGMVGRELKVPLDQVPLQVLRDFEAIRIPMVFGVPERLPGKTRNPALVGLMDLRKPVVVALVREGGMRWGMDGFGSESSDAMHFDSARAPYSA